MNRAPNTHSLGLGRHKAPGKSLINGAHLLAPNVQHYKAGGNMEQVVRLMKLQAEMVSQAKTQKDKMKVIEVFTQRIQMLSQAPQRRAA